jgi:beta-N-acetylhexosaminidase
MKKGSKGQGVKGSREMFNLKEKIGQLIIAHLDGSTPFGSEEFQSALRLVENYSIGGFIVFGGDCSHTPRLIDELQTCSKLPLFFASDMENGVGQQLKGGVEFPSNMALGATYSPELAFEEGKAIAREAKSFGINILFAPVLDVNTHPANPIINTRSYGDKPELVSLLGSSFIKGIQAENVIATAKHFPGHGHTELDSHLTLPVLNVDKEHLYRIALPPFISAINQGVQAVMIAHLYAPALDGQTMIPASLSYQVINNLLKKELSFKGLIITDSLRMKGLTDYLPEERASFSALNTGVDILLHPADPEKLIQSIYVEALKDNQLTGRIEEAETKIREVKKRLLQPQKISSFDPQRSRELSLKIARGSITLVKDDQHLIPLNVHSSPELLIIQNNPSAAKGEVFIEEIKKRIPIHHAYLFPPDWKGTFPDLRAGAPVICAIFSRIRAYQKALSPAQAVKNYIHNLLKDNRAIILIYLGNPYLVSGFPEAPCSLCTYSDSGVSQKAAVEAIFGEIPLRGRLPISLKTHD